MKLANTARCPGPVFIWHNATMRCENIQHDGRLSSGVMQAAIECCEAAMRLATDDTRICALTLRGHQKACLQDNQVRSSVDQQASIVHAVVSSMLRACRGKCLAAMPRGLALQTARVHRHPVPSGAGSKGGLRCCCCHGFSQSGCAAESRTVQARQRRAAGDQVVRRSSASAITVPCLPPGNNNRRVRCMIQQREMGTCPEMSQFPGHKEGLSDTLAFSPHANLGGLSAVTAWRRTLCSSGRRSGSAGSTQGRPGQRGCRREAVGGPASAGSRTGEQFERCP